MYRNPKKGLRRPTYKGQNKHRRHPAVGTKAYYAWLAKTYGHARGKSTKRVKMGRKMFRKNNLGRWAGKVAHGLVRRNRKGQIIGFSKGRTPAACRRRVFHARKRRGSFPKGKTPPHLRRFLFKRGHR